MMKCAYNLSKEEFKMRTQIPSLLVAYELKRGTQIPDSNANYQNRPKQIRSNTSGRFNHMCQPPFDKMPLILLYKLSK